MTDEHHASHRAPARLSEPASYLATASSLPLIGLGLLQLFSASLAAPFSGVESGAASSILAIQWCALGAMLAAAGLLRHRRLLEFSADALLIVGTSGAVVMMLGQTDTMPLAVHGAIALVGFLTRGLARFTGKNERMVETSARREGADERPASSALEEMKG